MGIYVRGGCWILPGLLKRLGRGAFRVSSVRVKVRYLGLAALGLRLGLGVALGLGLDKNTAALSDGRLQSAQKRYIPTVPQD
jgi:hypothetical protein